MRLSREDADASNASLAISSMRREDPEASTASLDEVDVDVFIEMMKDDSIQGGGGASTSPSATNASRNEGIKRETSLRTMYRRYSGDTRSPPVEYTKTGSSRFLATGEASGPPAKSSFATSKDNGKGTMDASCALTAVTRRSSLSAAPSSFFFNEEDEGDLPESDRHGSGGAVVARSCHTRTILKMHKAVIRALQSITGVAVEFPRTTIVALSILSLCLLAGGWLTNFYIETSSTELWPPRNCLSLDLGLWVWQESHFNWSPIIVDIIIHKNGEADGVLGREGVDRVFEVQEAFTNFGNYKEGCAIAEIFGDQASVGQCWIHSVADFWNESYSVFNETVDSDQDVINTLSQTLYPSGIQVDVGTVMGKTTRDINGTLASALSYSIKFGIPWSNTTLNFEARALNHMLALRDEWTARGDEFTMEIRSRSSFSNEFLRAIQGDLWLFPITFGVVVLFTVFFGFGKWDRVMSQGLLGFGAVVTIVASIMASFGILFIIGIPFTTQTMMVPFLMFGIGLDDAFIIHGSYNRRAHIKDIKERIHSTMEDVGVSIFLTTVTSMLAFILGSFSDIAAVRWLCMYAFPCIGIDFLYQITFFVAMVTLDERRIEEGRMDFCSCITVRPTDPDEGNGADDIQDSTRTNDTASSGQETHAAERLMSWWADQLLKPWVQTVSLIAFGFITGASILCATHLEQEFDFVDAVPQDSYLKNFYGALDSYTTMDGVYGYAYFRNADQSHPYIQQRMLDYLDDLVATGQVDEPVYVWVRDFQKFSEEQSTKSNSTFRDMAFQEQMNEFLSVDIYHELYDEQISQTEDGVYLDTRVRLHFSFDIQSTKAATDMLFDMRAVSSSEILNQEAEEWKFFTYVSEYFLYEFYNQVVKELIFTSVCSVVAVSFIALVFMPHWTAVLFVFPFISILYVNMLGYLYLSGVQINAISYVTLVMSIGLMIDYIMHILMRYYESCGTREERVRETMSSVGSSILLGAASTFLGVMCLSMSTSDILKDVFVAVVGLIVFGVLNGLVFLPIALARFGPQGQQTLSSRQEPIANFDLEIMKQAHGPVPTDTLAYPPLAPNTRGLLRVSFDSDDITV